MGVVELYRLGGEGGNYTVCCQPSLEPVTVLKLCTDRNRIDHHRTATRFWIRSVRTMSPQGFGFGQSGLCRHKVLDSVSQDYVATRFWIRSVRTMSPQGFGFGQSGLCRHKVLDLSMADKQ